VLNAIKKTGKQVLIRPTNDGHDEAVPRDIVRMPEQPYVINLMCDLADRVGECPAEMREKLYYAPYNRFGDAIIDFDPENRVKPFLPRALLRGLPGQLADKLFPYHTDPRWRPDDLLIHELFHALRILAIPNLWKLPHWRLENGFGKVEELYAILVANMYRSELGLDDQLRGSHSSTFDVLDSNDLKIRLDYGLHLTRLETQMPELTSKLRALPTKFNPFRIPI
jgi:hypothetical protein